MPLSLNLRDFVMYISKPFANALQRKSFLSTWYRPVFRPTTSLRPFNSSTLLVGHTPVSPSTPPHSAVSSLRNRQPALVPSPPAPVPVRWLYRDDRIVTRLLHSFYRRRS